MSLRTFSDLLVVVALLLIAWDALADQHEDDLDSSNGARQEMIEEQKRQREESPYDTYGCPKEAPYTCVTDPFTLAMYCSCGGIGRTHMRLGTWFTR